MLHYTRTTSLDRWLCCRRCPSPTVSEYDSGVWKTAEDLMRKADAKYVELKNQNLWGKRSADSQIVALTAVKSDNKSGGKNKNKHYSANWKKDRSLSSTSTYKRGDKIYHWCTGPGHNKTAMWTIHAPGTCHDRPNQANRSNAAGGNGSSAMMNRDALTAMLTAKGGLSADEIEKPLPFGIVLSRHDIRPRYRPAQVSPSPFGILPEMYVALSHIQLRMDFLRFYAHVPRLHMEQTFLKSFGICLVLENLLLSLMANIYRLFRKPPDKWIEFHDCILQCKSTSCWRTWTLKA
eukprot:scaffold9041_cov171-Cylindrotheca_fusiformis.AAC.1